MQQKDTIYALSSGRPPAAISVIRISGPAAHVAGTAISKLLPTQRVAALREFRHPRTGELLDHGIIVRFDAPASSTGEDIIELQCHGGRAVVLALLEALGEIDGLRQAEPGEFTRRAFENERIDLTEAEGLADLIEAETELQRKSALALTEGALSKQINEWRDRILTLSARAEHAIDYDEDDLAFDESLAEACSELATELGEWLARPRTELLKQGVLVVVAGPPNAGKSSLINAIAGEEKAIVTAVPGTTRDSIEVPLSIRGVPIRLTDTAGLRETSDLVEAIGVGRANKLVEGADVLLWLGEHDRAPCHPRMIAVHAKADLADGRVVPEDALSVSARTNAGVHALVERIEELARSVLPAENQIVLNQRQAELLGDANDALLSATSLCDVVLFAERLRQARSAFDRLTGRAGVEHVLDALFGRFCLGK